MPTKIMHFICDCVKIISAEKKNDMSAIWSTWGEFRSLFSLLYAGEGRVKGIKKMAAVLFSYHQRGLDLENIGLDTIHMCNDFVITEQPIKL